MHTHTFTITSTQLGRQLCPTTIIQGLYIFTTRYFWEQEVKDQEHLALAVSSSVQTQRNSETSGSVCSREYSTNPQEETLWVP